MKIHFFSLLFILFLLPGRSFFARPMAANMSYVITIDNPARQDYHVVLTYRNLKKPLTELNMCAWTPGYYEILDYAKAVKNFGAKDIKGKAVSWKKSSPNVWQLATGGVSTVVVSYDVHATTLFVGNVFLDTTHGYITPGGLFMYAKEELSHPVTVQIIPWKGWNSKVYTGLDVLPGKNNTFYAADFDVLYDSPFLEGNLEELPSFTVGGKPHSFVAYGLGVFDKKQFMDSLQTIIKAGTDIIRDIPYTHYTFLGIGRGGGGIEHLNSTSVSYRNNNFLSSPEAIKGYYGFLAHEYFHHYNVKRIRPIELGPFDYSKENITSMLWVSEGITDYYAAIMEKTAGITHDTDILKVFQNHIRAYENKPGHLYQSATEASRATWNEPPFGKDPETDAKTISYYDKGCIVGLILDLKIRHETKNQHSLDDVMRTLYKDYYQTKKRGFTEKEFRDECEKIAGVSLDEELSYASTVKPVDYPKYFAYAGLQIDTAEKELPAPYPGVSYSPADSGLTITAVTWNSPAWQAGLRNNDIITRINDVPASVDALQTALQQNSSISMQVAKGSGTETVTVKPGKKSEKSFAITKANHAGSPEQEIYRSWLRE